MCILCGYDHAIGARCLKDVRNITPRQLAQIVAWAVVRGRNAGIGERDLVDLIEKRIEEVVL